MTQNAQRELVDFLHRAFDPVLKAKPDGSDADKKKFERVQEATRAEIERFHSYGSAEEVVVNFKRDLNSAPAKKMHEQLRALGLPTINDLRDEFEEKARKLGVKG